MAVSPETVLFTMASVIVIGFLGQVFFRLTRVSDILLLIAVGILIGAVLRPFDTSGFVVLAPVIGVFALLVILFEGGLDLHLGELVRGLPRASLLALLSFTLTSLGIAAAAHYLLDMDWLRGMLLGSILGGSSSIAVMPVVRSLPTTGATRVILSLESALTDVFCVVGAITISSVLALQADPQVQAIARTIVNGFLIATVIGLLAGVVWLKLLDSGRMEGAAYMLTLGILLLLHVTVDGLEASGPIAVLAFGIVLGNGHYLRRALRTKGQGFNPELRRFQGEIAFVTRAFFFVYLGVILDLRAFQVDFIAPALVLFGAIVLARAAAVYLAALGAPALAPDRFVWLAMLPRGLAAAVLASVPALTYGITGTETFVSYAALLIILTNVAAALAPFITPKLPPAADPNPSGTHRSRTRATKE